MDLAIHHSHTHILPLYEHCPKDDQDRLALLDLAYNSEGVRRSLVNYVLGVRVNPGGRLTPCSAPGTLSS